MARKALIEFRRDTAANWTATNPVLATGEPGWESDTSKLKIGDGATAWSSLAYFNPGASGVSSLDSITGAVTLVAGTNVTITDNSPSAGHVTIAATGGGGGSVVGHGSQSSDKSSSGTTFAGGQDLLASAISFTADGTSDYLVTVYAAAQTNTGVHNNILRLNLDSAASDIMVYRDIASAGQAFAAEGAALIAAPSAAAHTVNVRLYTDGGTATVYAATLSAKIIVVIEKLA